MLIALEFVRVGVATAAVVGRVAADLLQLPVRGAEDGRVAVDDHQDGGNEEEHEGDDDDALVLVVVRLAIEQARAVEVELRVGHDEDDVDGERVDPAEDGHQVVHLLGHDGPIA